MSQKLGIAVVTGECMEHVLGLARAARKAGKKTEVFLTGDGVHLTQDRRFSALLKTAKVGVCETSYRVRGYQGLVVPGLVNKDFVTQARNAEMVRDCDRYIVL